MTTQHSGRATSDYVARNEKEITVKIGQAVEIESIRGQWWLVRTSNGQSGYVPSHCLESYDADIPAHAPSHLGRDNDLYSERGTVRESSDERQDKPRRILISRRVVRDDTIGYNSERSTTDYDTQSFVGGQSVIGAGYPSGRLDTGYGTGYGTSLGNGLNINQANLGTDFYGLGSGFPAGANSAASGIFQSRFNAQPQSAVQGQQLSFAGYPQGAHLQRTPTSLGASGFGTPTLSAPGFRTPNLGVPGFGAAGLNTATLGVNGFGAQTLGTPGFANSTLGTPGFGTPNFGIPGFANSTLGTPGFGTPNFGIPGLGTASVVGAPTLGAASYGAQVMGQPGFSLKTRRK